MRFASLVALMLPACGGGDEPECRFDVDCALGKRCVAQRCEPVDRAGRDAAVTPGRDAEAPGEDASAGLDSGIELDAAADAAVAEACQLQRTSDNAIDQSLTIDDTPALVRAGLLFGVLYRAPPGNVVARFLDEVGATVGAPNVLLSDGGPESDLALAADEDGKLLAAWIENETVIHAATVDGAGVTPIVGLGDGFAGTFFPALAWTGSGFVLAWSDSSVAGQDEVWTRDLDANGSPLFGQDPMMLPTPDVARRPTLASNEDGDVPLAWQDLRGARPALYAGLREGDGSVDEIAVSEATLLHSAALVTTPFGVYAAWVEPAPVEGGLAVLHVSRLEDGQVGDHVLERVVGLDGRTSIAFDGQMLLVGWQNGDAEEAFVDTLSLGFQSQTSLSLGGNTAQPRIAADDRLSAVVWVDTATSEIRFGALECVAEL